MKENVYLNTTKKFYDFFRDLFYAISIISISVLSVLNMTIVYKYVIQKYELNNYTGLSTEILMDNYNRVINYVQNPFDHELVLNSLTMSNFGKIHFYEVKRIFIALYIFSIIFIILMIFKLVKLMGNKRSKQGKKLVESFNRSVNIIAIIFAIISAATIIDFPKTFYIFHKIFFRNDYWIFDPVTDPIINALPEELFMIELILILTLLIIFTGIIKVLHSKNVTASKGKM
ncbi:TIGR01906 family membrane protein [Clostridium chromiireducens]|uniref:TIGR01906 family membrane protein n=1 Tax=Clostridium chromiireducens TaxID=225345 RepID=UPI0015F955C6|nr:TIGR01906 family membrane protein [Clostridium chromiireducens]